MSNQRSYYQPKFLQEIQLGLVVYGGISLAIYTHGICQEFYHAVRGRGIYKLIKAMTDADLVVDLISGSSAGGIEGILLSYALTNSNDRELVDFSAFASIWRNTGDLLKLLRKPNLFKTQAEQSGFDREIFDRSGLVSAFARGAEHKMPRPPHEWFSASTELDLAISGTNYFGTIDRTLTETGINIGAKNHRTLFHLKHRQGRKEPFNPNFNDPNLPRSPGDTYQALAKLCQISAGTPMIFPLVEVDLQDRRNLVDRQLVTWGRLEPHYSLERPLDLNSNKLYFLDGGLLDSAPFTCLMKAAYYRLPTRSGRRKLFYVDPNPEGTNERISLSGDNKSRLRQVLKATMMSMPIAQSISNDLRAIQEHNHKVRRYQASIDRLEVAIDSQQLLASGESRQSQMYLRGRLFDFRDRNLPLLLHSDLGSQNTNYSIIIEKIDVALTNKITNSQDKIHHQKLLNRFASQIIDLDVEYGIRKHFYIIDRIADLSANTSDLEVNRQLQHLSRQLSCNIKLLEVVRSGIELLLSDRSIGTYFYFLLNQEAKDRRLRALVYEFIFRFHRFLLDGTKFRALSPDSLSGSQIEPISDYFWIDLPELAAQNNSDRWLSQTKISSAFAQIEQRINDLRRSSDLHRLIWVNQQLEYDNNANSSFPSILRQISLAAEILIEKSANIYTDELLKQWNTFNVIDRELYPFEYLTSLSEKNIINPICISPENAQLGIGNGKKTQEKLGGDRLYNIGGVFKKSWRSNDLLWGRLDGLNRIVEGVITPKSVASFANFINRESARTNRSREQYLDWLVTNSLPHLSGDERQKIDRHLDRLARLDRQIDRVELREIVADLVLAGQREILASDVHSIVEGIDENQAWWRLSGNTHPSKVAGSGLPEPTSSASAIVRIFQQSLANLAAQQKHFFRDRYRLGIGKLWENMLLVKLINLGVAMTLNSRNLLAKVFGRSSRTFTSRQSFYHLLDGGLLSMLWWLQSITIELGSVPSSHTVMLMQLLSALTAIVGVILAFSHSPLWLLLTPFGIIACLRLQSMRQRYITAAKSTPFLPLPKE